jgi:two-component system sensor histidine kinase DesK
LIVREMPWSKERRQARAQRQREALINDPRTARISAGALMAWSFVLVPIGFDIPKNRFPVLAICAAIAFVVGYVVLVRMSVADGGDDLVRLSLLGLLAAIALGTGIGYGSYWYLLFVLLAMSCAVALPAPGPAMLGFLGTTVVLTVVASHDPRVSSYASSAAMSGFIVWLMRRLFGTIAMLQQVREELAVTAVADERLRFARDLHDLLGHTLSLIVVKSEVVRRLAHSDPDAAAREAADIETVGRNALTEIRQAVSGYREQGLAAELEQAQRALTAAGVGATVRTTGAPYPQAVDVVAGWLVREGVTNVIRHSRARRCDIEVRRVGEEIVATVEDDGIGAGTGFSAGNGLAGLTERAELIGGRVTARPVRRGFRLEAVMPTAES